MWKKSGVLKNRKFQIVILVELLLLCYGIWGLLQGEQTVCTYETMNMELTGGGLQDAATYYVDGSTGVYGDWLMAGGFELTPGVYRLQCTYEATDNEVNTIGIRAKKAPFQTVLANDASLYSGVQERSCQFYVTGKVGPEQGLEIVIGYYGSQPLTVSGLEIVKTTAGSRIFLFWLLMGSLAVNSLIMLYEYTKEYSLTREWKLVWFGIPALAILSSLPLLVDYIILGADAIFHLLRIEFLAESLAQGIFPTRVEPMWMYGHGYANSLFYCDTFLTIPALFRLIGFPMNASYGMFVFLVNLATAMVAYVSFRGIFDSKYIGLLGSMLYTLAPYRIYNIYNRTAVGEYTAMIFLPLVALGFYLLLGRPEEEQRKHPHDWMVLVLGFSGIVQSHVLTCEIVGIFSVVLCVLCIKRVFRKRTFLGLVKAVCGTLLVNLWFLVPMLDMMVSGSYRYSQNSGNHIQERGILAANILYTAQEAGSNSRFHELGLWDTEPITVGIAILFALVVFFLLRKSCKKQDKHSDATAMVAFAIGVLAIAVSTRYFPWDAVQDGNAVTGMLVPMIQFPTRLTTVATVSLVVVACTAAKWMQQCEKQYLQKLFLVTLCGLCILFSMNQVDDTLFVKDGVIRIYTVEGIGHSNALGAEYLPLGVEQTFVYHDALPSEGVTVSSYSKKNLDTQTSLKVASDSTEGWVELPMLYYKGYRASDIETGEALTVVSGTNGHVRVLLEPGYEGTIRTWYAGMWYWRAAEAVSLLALLGLAGIMMWSRRKK